jgi:uncharacterized membrane protein (UPF0127 family)
MQPESRRSRLAAHATLLAAATLVAVLAHAAPALEELGNFPRATVEIASGDRVHRFDVWVADTPERQAQGLMFVRDLAPDAGMLFVHDAPREVSMWMKNTYIPLDMLFIDRNGRVVRIAHETTPHSLESITSGAPVTQVLELRGGEAARRGIAVGDRARTKS